MQSICFGGGTSDKGAIIGQNMYPSYKLQVGKFQGD